MTHCRKVLRAYQDSWQNRCRFLFCCSAASDRNRNSFADIARLLSDFFRDLDVVPSDVVVGLVLLRKFQKIEQKAIVEQVCTTKTHNRALQQPKVGIFKELVISVPQGTVLGPLTLVMYGFLLQRKNDTYEFLSGVAVTPRTQFLSLHEDGSDLELFQTVIHFAHFAVRAYGWPIYVMTESMGLCRLCTGVR